MRSDATVSYAVYAMRCGFICGTEALSFVMPIIAGKNRTNNESCEQEQDGEEKEKRGLRTVSTVDPDRPSTSL